MKSFLSKFLLISLIMLTFCIGFELFLLIIPNEYSYKRKYVEEQGDKIKVLVLGHSHTAYGIVPECLGDSVFNMAVEARDQYYDAILTERYAHTLKNLKCVIWPLRYNAQYKSFKYPCTDFITSGGTNKFNTQQCMHEKYLGISYEKYIPYLHWSELINSELNYCGRIFKRYPEERILCSLSGYKSYKRSVHKEGWEKGNLPIQVNYNSPNAPLAKQEGLNNMKRIAETCRRAGVRLVVITTPCYQSFLDQTTERGIKEMQECVDSMRSVYPDMEYYNFMTDPRFTEDDFIDSSHLVEEGAEKLSKKLKDTLNL